MGADKALDPKTADELNLFDLLKTVRDKTQSPD